MIQYFEQQIVALCTPPIAAAPTRLQGFSQVAEELLQLSRASERLAIALGNPPGTAAQTNAPTPTYAATSSAAGNVHGNGHDGL